MHDRGDGVAHLLGRDPHNGPDAVPATPAPQNIYITDLRLESSIKVPTRAFRYKAT